MAEFALWDLFAAVSGSVVQPRVGIMAHDSIEHVAAMLGCYRARVVPFNINFRYEHHDLSYLIADARPAALFVSASLEPVVRRAVSESPGKAPLVIVIGEADTQGSASFAQALATDVSADLPVPTPDDRYLLYTGGTTGKPKGTIWRHADIAAVAMGGSDPISRQEFASLAEVSASAADQPPRQEMFAPPLIHGLGQWGTFRALVQAATVIMSPHTESFRATEVLEACRAHEVWSLAIAGDAFGVPLIEHLAEHPMQLPHLRRIATGSVRMSAGTKTRLMNLLPDVTIIEGVGGSETGAQMITATVPGQEVPPTTTFEPRPGTVILDDARARVLGPGEPDEGWLASSGRIPMGYLGDADRTQRLFVTVDGVRYIVGGDRATWAYNGMVQLVGRSSLVINSGGEKVFVEEVESALLLHGGVRDAVVCGIPHERWGTQVAAAVTVDPATHTSVEAIRSSARSHLASYKVPGRIVIVDEIPRTPAGKVSYEWVRRVLAEHSST
jgi:acyl-CoA synthetase (AMP-forming)/AMP-acid ligase II